MIFNKNAHQMLGSIDGQLGTRMFRCVTTRESPVQSAISAQTMWFLVA